MVVGRVKEEIGGPEGPRYTTPAPAGLLAPGRSPKTIPAREGERWTGRSGGQAQSSRLSEVGPHGISLLSPAPQVGRVPVPHVSMRARPRAAKPAAR